MMAARQFPLAQMTSRSRTDQHKPAAVNIPTEELTRLMLGVADAFQLAALGDVRAGYRLLCDGLFRARELTADWTADLTQLWSLSLAHFIKRYPTDWFSSEI